MPPALSETGFEKSSPHRTARVPGVHLLGAHVDRLARFPSFTEAFPRLRLVLGENHRQERAHRERPRRRRRRLPPTSWRRPPARRQTPRRPHQNMRAKSLDEQLHRRQAALPHAGGRMLVLGVQPTGHRTANTSFHAGRKALLPTLVAADTHDHTQGHVVGVNRAFRVPAAHRKVLSEASCPNPTGGWCTTWLGVLFSCGHTTPCVSYLSAHRRERISTTCHSATLSAATKRRAVSA